MTEAARPKTKLITLLCAIFLIGAQLALIFGLPVHAAEGDSLQEPLLADLSAGSLTTQDGQAYLVVGRSDENNPASITVPGGTSAFVTLRDVTIDLSTLTRGAAGPIVVEAGAHLTLRLEGKNQLEGMSGTPGMLVPTGASLDIHGPGGLVAIGNGGGAGIGSGAATGRTAIGSGDICIYSGTVEGRSNADGAGIGGGVGTPAGTIIVCGGTVTAKSAWGGAGIGGGAGAGSGSVQIYGGVVNAQGGDANETLGGGAGIGGGAGGDAGTVYVYNATVQAGGGHVTIGEGGAGAGIGGGGGNPSAGAGFGGGLAGANLFAMGTAIKATGGSVDSGDGGAGAGVGGGGASSLAGLAGVGRSIKTHQADDGIIEAAGGIVNTTGRGAAGAGFGDGGQGNSGGNPTKAVRPEALAVPGDVEITEMYLNGYLCEYNEASRSFVASLPGDGADLDGVEVCFVASPGALVLADGAAMVNGVSTLDFADGEATVLTIEAGENASAYNVLALPSGQSHFDDLLPALPDAPNSQPAGEENGNPPESTPADGDGQPAKIDTALVLGVVAAGFVVAGFVALVLIRLSDNRRKNKEE